MLSEAEGDRFDTEAQRPKIAEILGAIILVEPRLTTNRFLLSIRDARSELGSVPPESMYLVPGLLVIRSHSVVARRFVARGSPFATSETSPLI